MLVEAGVFAVTIIMLVTVGAALNTGQFLHVLRQKRLVLFSVVAPAIVLPLLAFVLVRVLPVPAVLVPGILLLAACPVGDIANFYVLLARGNAALSVTADVITCLLSSASMSLIFGMYQFMPGAAIQLATPSLSLVCRMTLLVVIPIVIGIVMRRAAPRFTKRIESALQVLTAAGLIFVLATVFITQHEQLARFWRPTIAVAAVMITAAFICGYSAGSLLGLKPDNRFTLGVVFAVRNVGLAMAVAITLLHRPEYAGFAAVYFVTEFPLLLTAVALRRRTQRAKAITSPAVGVLNQSYE